MNVGCLTDALESLLTSRSIIECKAFDHDVLPHTCIPGAKWVGKVLHVNCLLVAGPKGGRLSAIQGYVSCSNA